MVDLNAIDFEQTNNLMKRLERLKDPRKPRGIRHNVTSTLAVDICAILSGSRSFVAIGEWAGDSINHFLMINFNWISLF